MASVSTITHTATNGKELIREMKKNMAFIRSEFCRRVEAVCL